MTNLKSVNREIECFGAISKNCKTVIIDRGKNPIKRELHQRGIAKCNIAMFKCRCHRDNKITTKLINCPKFKLTLEHHTVLRKAIFNFCQCQKD